ncbi:MAG: AraC family transcriptional regulator [Acutalibacteraceae bacterium]|nr:AraC family transcriptional regulator [Acutalibacteraceae bacterium]
MFYQVEHIGAPEHLVVEKNCDYSFPPHIHQCFEMITINEGTMNVTVDKRIYTLEKGESILIFPNQIHSLDSTQSTHTLCIFSSDYVKVFFRKTQNKIPENNKFVLGKELAVLFEQLETNESEIFRKGVLYLICDAFHNTATYKKQETDRDDLLYCIFAFVDKNFDGECSLSLLSKESGYNYSYISRYFKNVVGITFNEYVNNYRLNHACYLIKNNVESMLQCALDSGFVSLRTFNRSFKQRFKITPTQYKKMVASEL